MPSIPYYNSIVGTQVQVSGQNVGIGTSSPAYKLDVAGTGNINTLKINDQYIFPTGVGSVGDSLVYAGSNQVVWSGVSGGGTDTNDYVDSISFNTSDGVLTLGRTGALSDLTVDLDGRYLEAHPATYPASSSDNSGRTYIQDILLDNYGHVTGIATATETVTDTNTFVTGVEYNISERNIILSRNDGVSLTGSLDIVLHSGDNISLLNNDAGYLTSLSGTTVVGSSGYFDVISFNVDDESILTKAQISWDDTEGVLDVGLTDTVTMHVGQHRFYRIRNQTGSTLYKGQVVYATGVHSNGIITPSLYIADNSIDEIRFIGVILEDVSDNSNGYVIDFGHVEDMDLDGSATNFATGTETWVAGDILYAHPTVAGKLTNVKPKHAISVAIILDVGTGNGHGRMFVRPFTFGDIADIHDIDVSDLLDNQFLVYDSGTDYWKPSSGLYYVDGNLGIGTASPSPAGGGKSLHIHDTNFPEIKLTNDNTESTSDDGSVIQVVNSDLRFTNREDGNSISFYAFDTGGTSRQKLILSESLIAVNGAKTNTDFQVKGEFDDNLIRTDANTNRVGIGTDSPSCKLHVAGSGHFEDSVSIGYTALADHFGIEIYKDRPHIVQRLSDPSGFIINANWYGNSGVRYANIAHYGPSYDGITAFDIGASGSVFVSYEADIGIGSLSNDSLIFGTYNIERARITPAGYVGIGTDNPTNQLQVENGNVVFNDLGGTYDFRVEGDADQNLFLVRGAGGADKVGVGTATLHGKFNVYHSTTNNSFQYGMHNSANHYTTSNGTNYVLGNYTDIRKHVASGVTDTGYVLGHECNALLSDEGSLSSSFGLRTYAGINNQSDNGTLTTAYGIQSRVINYGQGTANINTAHGVNVYIQGDLGNAGNGKITTAYGLYVNPLYNVTTNSYGLYIAPMVNTTTNRYGVYQNGSNDTNVFMGNVGIGTNDPSSPLTVAASNEEGIRIHTDSAPSQNFIIGRNTSNGTLVFKGSQSDFSAYEFRSTIGGSSQTVLQTDRLTGAITFNDEFTFPTTDGSGNQAIITDGNGNLSWQSVLLDNDLNASMEAGDGITLVYDSGTSILAIGLNPTGVFDSLSINNEFTFPTTDGSADQVLVTNGSGVITWQNQSVGAASATAWGSYNGSTNARGQEYNVSSITDNGSVGDHTVNLSITMSSTDYCVVVNEYHRTSWSFGTSASVNSIGTNSFKIWTGGIQGTTNSAFDSVYVAYAVFGS